MGTQPVYDNVEKFRFSFALPAFTALALAGCAVVGSAPTFDEAAEFVGCRSTLGSYSLPKTVLRITITKKPGEPFHVLQSLAPERVPDNQHTFCLDYLRSPLASDQVRVFKNKIKAGVSTTEGDKANGKLFRGKRVVDSVESETTPFLQLIASRAVDHTSGIIRRFIRTAFILLTNKGTFAPARSAVGQKLEKEDSVVVADFQVDPFDYREMAQVNESVRKLGFCFVLEDHTYERSAGSADRYCRAPHRIATETPPHTAEAIRKLHYLVAKPVDGIFFRPRAGYRLSVYTKDDPEGRGIWRLGQMKSIHMENIMPIVSVGVGRAVFATRRTGLVFDDGTLINVCISKGSELQSAIQIPLDVVYGIIALPSEMITAAITETGTAKELLQAQQRLVAAQNDYIRFLNRDKLTAADLKKPDADKQKALKLGAAPQDPQIPDDSPDAGEILKEDDPLSEICAELAVVKTMDGVDKDGKALRGTF
jgi:hypothetical protein